MIGEIIQTQDDDDEATADDDEIDDGMLVSITIRRPFRVAAFMAYCNCWAFPYSSNERIFI